MLGGKYSNWVASVSLAVPTAEEMDCIVDRTLVRRPRTAAASPNHVLYHES